MKKTLSTPFFHLSSVMDRRLRHVLLLWLCTLCKFSHVSMGCGDDERRALLVFINCSTSFLEHDYSLNSIWKGRDCCRWKGVGCSNVTGHVESLSLITAFDSQHYDCPPSTGDLEYSLSRLKYLKHLDVSYGDLADEWTAGILGNLCTLQILWLTGSNLVGDLSGVLPRCMSNNLQELDLSYNQLTGDMPDWLGLMRNLSKLDLSNNHLNGSVPESLSQLTQLVDLDLSHNNITGNLPDWLGLVRNLSKLDLSYNLLNGSVPESLSQLTQLVDLDLSFNSLHGVVSEAHFANMTNLEELALSGNALIFNISSTWVPPFQLSKIYLGSCRVGPRFPSWLQTQRALYFVDLSNADIADVVPDWFWNATSGAGQLDISHNKLRGELPKSQTFCSPHGTCFQIIDLSSNQFHGRLPSICNTVGDISFKDNLFSGGVETILNNSTDGLKTAILSQNFLSGDIPSSICNISLIILDLSQNSFTGELPICNDSNLPWYTVMNFASNFLHGSIPRWIMEVGGLQVLRLNNNSFDGKIPTPLDTSSNDLVILDLGENKLMGNIPSWIGEKLSYNLKFLRLRSNMLKGIIPPSLSNLTSLQVLDLAHNELSGTIPHSFKNFIAMAQTNRTTTKVIDFPDPVSDAVAIQYSTFEETVDVVVKGRTLEYTKTLSLVMVLDLSRNRLSGEIPADLLDHLVGLQSLNLSNNQLTGNIPDKFGGMAQIEALDLSRNDFSGAIPRSIALLTSLSYLNLSHNNLSGRIPSGNQLQTLTDPSIYSGNLDLCGPPLSKCPGDQPSKVPTPAAIADAEGNNNSDDDMLGIYLGMGIGFAVGLWGFFGVLLYKYSWRIAYFHFVDGITRKFLVAK